MKTIRFIICVCLFWLTFTGCGKDSESEYYYAGYTITPEQAESMADSIRESITEPYSPETDVFGDTVVFWLDGGSVYHISRYCSSVSGSEKYHSGSVTEAASAGKNRVCSICGK